MPPRKLTLKTTHAHKGQRLDQVLAEWLPTALNQPVSKAKARKLVVAGAVYLNGKRVRIASKEIQANARIEAYIDLTRLMSDERSNDRIFEMTEKHVLFEDDDLIAVNKPPGLPTQPTLDEARDNLFASVKKFLGARESARGGSPHPYVGLHHRLDRDTSGIVLFTKSARANAGTAELFSKHRAQKIYQALTVVPADLPEDHWVVKNYLGRESSGGAKKKSRYQSVRSGGDFAHTDFRLIERLSRGLWVEAAPLTGRTHQIRVHLSEGGMPIHGDATYGGPPDIAPRLMLHAVSLTFPHPITNVETSIQSPLPEDFNQCLSRLRGA